MPPALARPLTREAARRAGAGLAQQAASVLKAVVQGPEAEPAGYGVELPRFLQALPYLSHAQLVQCSSHFGQRGQAVGGVASALASELSWRLKPRGEASDSARLRENLRADEVTTVFYAFSKVTPQLPEYRLLYEAISDGLLEGQWSLNHLQSVLIATALADTDTRLTDAMTAVLQPLLTALVENPQVREDITVDTLRFLVHAAARLPSPGLTGKELEALADCTISRLRGSSFSKQAHLMLSWLRLVPPPSAKEAHFKALQACGQALTKQKKSHMPAHPLPQEGLAPLIADLLAREALQDAPPLTPPVMQDIVKGLVAISWGVQRHQFAQSRSRSLSIDDWSEIMAELVKYCESHSIIGQAAASSSSRRNTLTLTPAALLPSWADQALFHVLFRAQQQPIPRNSPERLVQLSSLLTLLRLARRHRNVRPDPEFFAWSVRLVDVHQRAGNVEESLLADVVNELVPLLPEKERAKLTRVIMARSRGTVEAEPSQRLLAPVVQGQLAAPRLLERSQEEGEAGEASETSVRVVLAPATLSLGAEPEPEPLKTYVGATVATGATGLAGARLWALLAKAEKRAELAAEPAASTGMLQSAGSAEEEAPSSLLHVDSASSKAQESQQSDVRTPQVSTATAKVEELQRMLQSALLRVEALESKLADQERDAAKATDACEEPSDSTHRICGQSQSDGWLTQILEPVAEQIQPSSAAATLHLRRAFNFEQFRRAHSARLDTERMRVIVPPDHFPLWPIMKK